MFMDEPPKKNTTTREDHALETEVIWAVIGLYVFIAAVLLLVHHLQPEGQKTESSSPSPSHAERYGLPGATPRAVRPDNPPPQP